MGLSKDYRSIAKLRGGPGGWYCVCCNPYRCHPRKMKRMARRLARRTSRQRVREDSDG